MAWSSFVVFNDTKSREITFDFSKYRYRIRETKGWSSTVYFRTMTGSTVTSATDIQLPANSTYTITESYVASNNINAIQPSQVNIVVERELLNTAPTTPGAFTQPTGTLEIGDTKVISWGGSSDAEGNLHGYEFEVSVDGGSWINRGYVTTPSISYVIPTATTIKFRVRARDVAGLYSAYCDSAAFTVTKPAYYWDRYRVLQSTEYTEGPWKISSKGTGQVFMNLYKTYELDPVHNRYSVKNPWEANDVPAGSVGYYGTWDVNKYVAEVNGTSTVTIPTTISTKSTEDSVPVTVYKRGTLYQTGVTAVEGTYPTDGRHGDGYWYVRGSRVSQSIAPPSAFTAPAINAVLEPKQALTLAFGASTAPSISTYEVQSRYNDGAWQNVGTHTNALTRAFTVTTDKSLTTVEFRVRAKNTSGVYSDYVYSEAFTIQHNKIPTLTLETENNKTLYEKDTFTIKGSALEPDVGDVLIVYYRLNGGTARGIETKLSDGSAIPFNEQLLFQSGRLYKGETEITGKLTDGTAHTLEVWAEDNQGGESEIERRTFYVVPNRPPSLTIGPITDQSDLINADKVTITGEAFDPDGNDVVVRYRINNGINVEIHSGPAGPFSLDIPLSKMTDGENIIVVEVTDTYDFKYSKTIKLNKLANLTPLSQSVQRYTIVPPAGSAQGVLLWIKRDEAQDVTVEISMTNGTEPEDFKPMEFDSSGPDEIGTVEDFYKFRSDVSAEKIAIKLSWTGDKPFHQIQGALTQ